MEEAFNFCWYTIQDRVLCLCGFYLLLQVTEYYENRATPLQILKSRMMQETDMHDSICGCGHELQFWVDMNDCNKARQLQTTTTDCQWKSKLITDYHGTRFAFEGELSHTDWKSSNYFNGLPDTTFQPSWEGYPMYRGNIYCRYSSCEHWAELFRMLRKGWLDPNRRLMITEDKYRTCDCYFKNCSKCPPRESDPPPGYQLLNNGLLIKKE